MGQLMLDRAGRGMAGAPTDSRLLGALVAMVVGVLAIGMPVSYFTLGYIAGSAALQTKADFKAEIISQAIGRSPQVWRFKEVHLRELLLRHPIKLADEHWRIRSEQGELIVTSENPVGWPTMVRTAPLSDFGAPAGTVEVHGSLRELWAKTGLAALLGCGLAAALLAFLRGLQGREKRITDAMFDKQELARVTLHSIGDAVITVDTAERVDYLNPVAERLTQWTLAEARGKPLSEVCSLIDESTMEPVSGPLAKALRDGQVCPFSGKELALMRPDGTSVAIEDSAAPMRDRNGALIGGAMVFRDVSATRRMAQRITWAATHDALTGLVNRREFESRVEAALLSSQNSARHHVVCYLDLDQFKIVNDTCGHAAGDELLKQVAVTLQGKLRESDTLARLGGDEFGVLLEGCSLDRAQLIATDLMAAVRDLRFVWDGRLFAVGVSIGLVAINADTGSRAEIFSRADTACYSAKEQGRNRVCVFQSSDADMAQRRNEMGWAARLTSALEEERLTLYYQPYLPLGHRGAEGKHIEILLRLTDEDGMMVPPGSFLPAAERYNLMPAIDRWVIKSVFARYRYLEIQLGTPLTCAINLSGTTLNSEGILEFIQEQARQHRLPPGSVCFEITETAAINNMRGAVQFMQTIRALGFHFALDDFGIGTSSLAYLKTLPVDYLKIDGSFVRNIAYDQVDRAMADTINRVGHIMGLQTVGEYAESPEAISALRSLGVDFAQGYGVARPRPLPIPPASGGVEATSAHGMHQRFGASLSSKAQMG